jgi:hypothetical protein
MKCPELFFRKFQIIITKPQLSPKNEIARKGYFLQSFIMVEYPKKTENEMARVYY